MQKHERANAERIIGGEVSRSEIGALVCDVLLLCIFLYNQIFYGLDMWFAILPLLAIGIYLVLFGAIPEQYRFAESSLEVWHLGFKIADIPYEAVFNCEAKSRDNFINLLQDNKVKVYYTAGKTKKVTTCRPRDVAAFETELKNRCPEFKEDGLKSKLEVFFDE